MQYIIYTVSGKKSKPLDIVQEICQF